MSSGIYHIINLKTCKFYIGSSSKIERRWSYHLWELRKNIHTNPHLQRSYNLYGENSFKFEIVEIVQSKYDLIIKEQKHIDAAPKDLLYNMNFILSQPPIPLIGRKLSEETKAKISATKRANPYKPIISAFQKSQISKAQSGRVKTTEHRLKISQSLLGRSNISSLKKWKLTHPCGKIEIFLGLNEPARLYNLNAHDLNAVANKRQHTHKGFKCELYTE